MFILATTVDAEGPTVTVHRTRKEAVDALAENFMVGADVSDKDESWIIDQVEQGDALVSITEVKTAVLHTRHPDDSSTIDFYVDGAKASLDEEEIVDPGAGYEAEDYVERRDSLRELAERDGATQWDKDCYQALLDYRNQFRKYAFMDGDEWDRIVDAKEVPEDYPVKVLGPDDPAQDRVTCGTCGRSWDDAVVTGMTPAPSGRCPFEQYHEDEEGQ